MNNQPNNHCTNVEPMLTAYLLGDLPAETAAQVKAHLEQCAACRAAAHDLEATLGFLRDALVPGSAGALTGESAGAAAPQLGQTEDARLKLGTTNGSPVLDAAHLEAIRRSVREAAVVSPADGATARTASPGTPEPQLRSVDTPQSQPGATTPLGSAGIPASVTGRKHAVLHMKDFRKRFPFLFWRNTDNSLRPTVLFFLKTAATLALLGVLVWLLLPSITIVQMCALETDFRGGTEFSTPLCATQSSARPSSATVEFKSTAMQVQQMEHIEQKIETLVDKMDEVVPTVERPNISDGSASSYALGLSMRSESGGAIAEFNNDMPATADGGDTDSVLDVKMSNSPIRIAGIYGGRSEAGRRGMLAKYGGGDVSGGESASEREEAKKREAVECEQLRCDAPLDQDVEQAQKAVEQAGDKAQPASVATTYEPVVAAAEPVADVPPPPAEALANLTLEGPAPGAAVPEEKVGLFGKLKGLVTTTPKRGAAVGAASADVAKSPSAAPASPMPVAAMGVLTGATAGGLLGEALDETVKDYVHVPQKTTVSYAFSESAVTIAPTSEITESDSGTLALNGTNSYTGTTIVSAGKVVAAGKPADEPPPAPEPVKPLDVSSINPFVATDKETFSTFGIDVDTAAYTLARNAFRENRMTEPNKVRVEEFVNAFDYDYAPPPAGRAFAIYADSAPSPFRPRHELLKIGVKGYQLARNAKAGAVLTFAIDGSGSMNTEDRLGLVRSSLKLLLGQLRPDDRVAIVQFNDKARLLLSATPVAEKQKILAAIDAIQAAGPTNLEGGLRTAYETAASAFTAGAANRVLLLSDGVANLGAAGADDILKTIEAQRKQGIYLSVYGVGSGTYNDKMLQQLADKGDGTYQFLDSEAEAKRVFVDQLAANLFTIAKDVKIQVEFNKARVAQYRQLGYEKRKLTKEQFRDDTVDAGEVGAGQSATALYELVLRGAASEPVGIVRVRYKNIATGVVEEIQQTITTSDRSADSAQAPVRFRLAACVAEFAELLRGSPHVQGSSYADVAKVLRPVVLELRLNGQVQELGRLVHQAEGMAGGR